VKKIIISIGILIVIGVGLFIYFTRPPSEPTVDINTVGDSIKDDKSDNNVYRISQERSVVTFEIDEVLRGSPFTVVGTTSQISGDVRVNDDITLGTLHINAKTFKTDSPQRDGAIVRLILKSESPENEFITFTPKNIHTTPAGVTTVEGDLTISSITKPALFELSLDVNDELGEIKAIGKTTIKRSDFGLVIPNIPFVANVPDEFTVTAEVVAERIVGN
jgi:polyisoprenoid-binding protein YceI